MNSTIYTPISNIRGNAKALAKADGGSVRTYAAVVTSDYTINGLHKTRQVSQTWEVGHAIPASEFVSPGSFKRGVKVTIPTAAVTSQKKSDKAKSTESSTRASIEVKGAISWMGEPLTGGLDAIDASYRPSSQATEDFVSKARAYAHHTGDFRVADHSAIVERLASFVAAYTLDQTVNSYDLSRGEALSLHSIAAYTSPLGAQDDVIWLPHYADDSSSQGVFGAIIWAAAAVGSVVVTDRLAIDQQDRSIVPWLSGWEAARGALEALRILGSNYQAAGAGGLFALAMATGLTKVLSVASSGADGLVVRDVLRSIRYKASYGGINTANRGWAGIPQPVVGSYESIVGIVDFMALQVAASSSVADPLAELDGRVYPTVFVAANMPIADPLSLKSQTLDPQDTATAGACSNSLLYQASSNSGAFNRNFVRELRRAWLLENQDEISSRMAENRAVSVLNLGWQLMAESGDTSVGKVAFAPYYWAEPTGILRLTPGRAADDAGYGVKCDITQACETPYFGGRATGNSTHYGYELTTSWSSARNAGIFLAEGPGAAAAGFVRVTGCEEARWSGLDKAAANGVVNWLRRGGQLNVVSPGAGRNAFPAPTDGLYLGTGLRLMVHKALTDATQPWIVTDTGMPRVSEITTVVTTTISPLFGYAGKGGDTVRDHQIQLRTIPLDHLSRGSTAGEEFGFFGVGLFVSGDVSVGETSVPARQPDTQRIEPAVPRARPAIAQPAPAASVTTSATGNILTPVVEHGSENGPRRHQDSRVVTGTVTIPPPASGPPPPDSTEAGQS